MLRGAFAAAALAVLADAGATDADESALSVYFGSPSRPISARRLKSMLDFYVPADSRKFLLFTECFSGGFAEAGPFNADPNTAVAAGAAPNQPGVYGGYHDDAIDALRPSAVRTGATVHQAGLDGRYEPDGVRERSNTGGGLPLDQFSLEPVSFLGAVQSRHVVVYAGQPTEKYVWDPTFDHPLVDDMGHRVPASDALDRDRVKANFRDEIGTTVRTVGGRPDPDDPTRGQNGWDHPSGAQGLERALREVREEILGSGNPVETEQFILVVTDHGERLVGTGNDGFTGLLPIDCPAGTRCPLGGGFATASGAVLDAVRRDVGATPGFELFLPWRDPPVAIRYGPDGSHAPLLGTKGVTLEIAPRSGDPIVLSSPEERLEELGDDVLGDDPGEGVGLFFPVDRSLFLGLLGGTTVTLTLQTGAARLFVTEVSATTGAVANRSAACETRSECLRDLGVALPVPDASGGKRTRRVARRLGTLHGRLDGVLARLDAAETPRRRSRLRRTAGRLLDAVGKTVDAADRRGRLDVPRFFIDVPLHRLRVVLRDGDVPPPGATTTTTSTAPGTTTTSTVVTGRALIGSTYAGGADVCLDRVTGGCTRDAHVPNCAGLHLHHPIDAIAGIPGGPFADPDPSHCGHGLVEDRPGCGPDAVPPCP